MRFILCLALTLVLSSPATAKEQLEVNLSRVIGIDTPITNNMGEVRNAMLKFAADGTGETIDIVLDSPGGSVFSGFQFVNAMEEVKGRGIRLRCFVNGLAASMAFQILVHCDERWALSRSFLLWHGVRTGVREPVTSKLAATLHEDLAAIDAIIREELVSAIGISEDVIMHHFDHETLHIGQNLEKLAPFFIHTKKYIPGLTEALTSNKVVRTSRHRNPFDFLFGGDLPEPKKDIQYIYNRDIQ